MSGGTVAVPSVELTYHNPDDIDLDYLTMVIHNPDESARHKRQAHRSIEKIKRRMRDPFISHERERLVKAQAAGAVEAVEQISNLIHDYDRRKYG